MNENIFEIGETVEVMKKSGLVGEIIGIDNNAVVTVDLGDDEMDIRAEHLRLQ